MSEAPGLLVRDGTCHALFAFDIGREIDVEQAGALLGGTPARPAGPGRPPYLHFERPPIRCTVATPAAAVTGAGLDACATIVLYEFGALTVTFTRAASGSLADLARLGAALMSTDDASRAARAVADDVVRRARPAIDTPSVDAVSEEYLVFHVRRAECDIPVAHWAERFPAELAAVLRAATVPLSSQEIAQALQSSASYGPGDLALLDWTAALVVRERADDVLAVLGFANVQLLELRYLDARLDQDLQRSYDAVRRAETDRSYFPSQHRGALEQIARRQIDAALLFEHVRNAPKLLGDQYLARVYEHASRRFRLADWNDSLHRKLDVLGTIYERLRDRAAVARLEVLEWIVIVLILISIVVPFVV